MVRVVAFVDGFNLYHAVAELRENHLKWLDIWSLCESFVRPEREERLVTVHYFSAYATHRHGSYRRHQTYVRALEHTGVHAILGRFKSKTRRCPTCGAVIRGHEEKETDVHLALGILDGAYQDEFDRALLVTNDSDIAPAVRIVMERFPNKWITVLTPPGRKPCREFIDIVGRKNVREIRPHRIRGYLLPDRVGQVRRPPEYDPPS